MLLQVYMHIVMMYTCTKGLKYYEATFYVSQAQVA